jgi:hypothetical protein
MHFRFDLESKYSSEDLCIVITFVAIEVGLPPASA